MISDKYVQLPIPYNNSWLKIFKQTIYLQGVIFLFGCSGNWNPNYTPKKNYPFFVTTEPITVKKLKLPVGTKLTYEEHFFRR